MRTVSALFDTYDQVVAAVDGLADTGIASSDITVIPRVATPARRRRKARVWAPALGLLAGLAVLALPGVRPGRGRRLAGARSDRRGRAGGVAGGIIGSLTGAGIEESDAHVYAEGVRRGGTLVIARVHDNEVGDAKAILLQSGAIDTNYAPQRICGRRLGRLRRQGYLGRRHRQRGLAAPGEDRPTKEPTVAPFPR